jgi:hypothetical protein
VLRFFAVPTWVLEQGQAALNHPESFLPKGETKPEAALARVEYRGLSALERALELAQPGPAPVVYARSPNDLPALLRTADQLLAHRQAEAGDPANLFACDKCQTQYAVPVSLMQPESMPCQNCGATIDLSLSRAMGETRISDPVTAQLNATRLALADFFREAMARGWPVLVQGT